MQPPSFYDSTPPAPPGLIWWNYKADVPPLPEPAATLGPEFARYGWRYDPSWRPKNYVPNNMDTVPAFIYPTSYLHQAMNAAHLLQSYGPHFHLPVLLEVSCLLTKGRRDYALDREALV